MLVLNLDVVWNDNLALWCKTVDWCSVSHYAQFFSLENTISMWFNYCLLIVQYLITHFNDFQLSCLGSFFLHESAFFLSGLPFIFLERAGWLSKYKIQVLSWTFKLLLNYNHTCYMWLGTLAKETSSCTIREWCYYWFSMLCDLIIGLTKAWTIVFMFQFQSSVWLLFCCMFVCTSTVLCRSSYTLIPRFTMIEKFIANMWWYLNWRRGFLKQSL